MMIEFLATAVAAATAAAPPVHPDPMISGAWLKDIAVAVILALGTGGGAWIVAWRKGAKQGESIGREQGRSERITLESPLPDMNVNMTRKYNPPTFGQHMELVRKVTKLEERTEKLDDKLETTATQIREDLAKQYVEILTAGEERERRITNAGIKSERELSTKLDGIARGFHARVDALIDAKPHTRK